MLLAEELVLLCMDDDTGQCLLPVEAARQGVATALIFELALDGALRRDDDRLVRAGKPSRDDEVLTLALDRVDGHTLTTAVDDLAQEELLQAMLVRLVSRGVLHDAEIWSPGVHLPRDPFPETVLRGRIENVLVRRRHPTEREAALVTLLDELHLIPLALASVDSPQVRQRATQVANNARTFAEDRVPTTLRERGRSRKERNWWDGLDILDVLTAPLRLFD